MSFINQETRGVIVINELLKKYLILGSYFEAGQGITIFNGFMLFGKIFQRTDNHILCLVSRMEERLNSLIFTSVNFENSKIVSSVRKRRK